MGEAKQRPFKSVWDDWLKALPPSATDLDFDDLTTLLWLVHSATWDEAILRTTISALAEAWDRNAETVVGRLGRLTEAKLIDTYFPRGHEGAVILRCYCDVVKVTDAQRESIRKAHAAVDEVRLTGAARAEQRRLRKLRKQGHNAE